MDSILDETDYSGNSNLMDEKSSIEDHPDYPNLLDEIEKYGNCNKAELIAMIYDESGEGETKQDLKKYSFGKLLVLLIDGIHGGGCQ